MIERPLRPPVRIGGRVVTTFEEAAVELGRIAKCSGDRDAMHLSRALREAERGPRLEALEGRLRAWSLVASAPSRGGCETGSRKPA